MENNRARLSRDGGMPGKCGEKAAFDKASTEPRTTEKGETLSSDEDGGFESDQVVSTAADLVTHIIKVEDDLSLNPWSFRMVFLGAGLPIFGGVLQEFSYFKPQTIYVSQVFLTVIAYVLGELMAYAIPRRGVIGRLLNPGPFNSKELATIALMSSAATQSAMATEALSAQELFYVAIPITPLLSSSSSLPSSLDSVSRVCCATSFYIFFGVLFVWTIIPEYIFPVLEGVSIFCLANQHSLVFTNLFGGASGNEGLGFLSLCFDWDYIASLGSPLWYPLYAMTNNFIGYIGCIILFMGEQGLPWLTGTYVVYLITSNMGLTATLTHMLLWNFEDIKIGWEWAAPSRLKKWLKLETYKFWANQETPEERLQRRVNDETLDPHYLLIGSFAVGLGYLYAMKSTLPWWGFIIANLLPLLFMLFFGSQYGLTGFQFNVQPICQMLAGYMFPGRPLANLRLAQQVHLSPRCTFFVQVAGCIIGALFNYVMIIVCNQSEVLLSIDGTNIWSDYQFISLAIAWSLAKDMFSIGGRYQWVTISYLVGFVVPVPFWLAHRIYPSRIFSYLNTSIILWYLGWLFVGINASIMTFFLIGFAAQFWLRHYHPHLFYKYSYVVSAALDGGTQVCVFILTFAVFGGSGTEHAFPTWTGNPDTSIHNLDYCKVNPATL
ncbi:OPT family oligopeptide transporter [Aspergillus saccharolyticus JOP 1030-1]|uniref:OPT superfamily oligopeptide transporter n=1 Tax=Aspergillus saccharolyticus JOP 1030-1 TaxID=1450539 RepID=A0A318ZLM6_9EURO|nr:OPT superfamily oligopeptide transporter [Aspergillus saccharolyticus JOP 1030-1]PYH47645.1 OPT superfamily oligopeptide transporter [Aspergillus saccharolyticus JOP 1030-1]